MDFATHPTQARSRFAMDVNDQVPHLQATVQRIKTHGEFFRVTERMEQTLWSYPESRDFESKALDAHTLISAERDLSKNQLAIDFDPGIHVSACMIDGECIGIIKYWLPNTLKKDFAEILWIASDLSHAGLAQVLIPVAVNEAYRAGFDRVYLSMKSPAHHLFKLYESLGFDGVEPPPDEAEGGPSTGNQVEAEVDATQELLEIGAEPDNGTAVNMVLEIEKSQCWIVDRANRNVTLKDPASLRKVTLQERRESRDREVQQMEHLDAAARKTDGNLVELLKLNDDELHNAAEAGQFRRAENSHGEWELAPQPTHMSSEGSDASEDSDIDESPEQIIKKVKTDPPRDCLTWKSSRRPKK